MEFVDKNEEEAESRETKGSEEGSDVEDDEDARFSDWESENDEEYSVKSLFASRTFPNIREVLEFDKQTYKFDLIGVALSALGSNIDEIALIKLVNYIRGSVQKASADGNAEFASEQYIADLVAAIGSREFMDDAYMRPILPEDDLLFLLPEYMQELGHAALFDGDDDDAAPAVTGATTAATATSASATSATAEGTV